MAIALILTIGLRISSSRSFQFYGNILQKVETQDKVVALTFDDGPTELTSEIIKILAELDVNATFFVTGKELEDNLGAGINLVEAGHELGSHSYSHQRMIFKSPAFIKNEIEKTDQLIRQVGHQGEIHFRPPYGKKLVILPYILRDYDKKTIMWDLEPESYPEIASDRKKIVEYVTENVKPGSIILLHIMYESRSESLNSLVGIVETLREKGYSFLTLSQLLKTNN